LAVFTASLALHGVHNEQRLDRVQRGVQVLDFLHQHLVDGQAAGGVDQQHVEVVPLGIVQRRHGDVVGLLVGGAREPLGAGLLGQGLELLDGRRAVHVAPTP
jgi:hypothetical protein